jgi:hypothetical protein
MFKFIVTIPIWYLIFRKFKTNRCILDCAFTFYFATLYWFGKPFLLRFRIFCYNHLRGSSQVGYLHTGLFYCIQFGVLHAYEYYKTNEEQQKIQSALRKQL